MNNWLTFILSLVGLLALYWVLFGQWKWNKMIRQEKEEVIEKKDKAK
ncbi:MAG: hypothetical protein KKC75_07145 [Nanoarchaeota archaeon]|nr:hypothetical protein [Nanoarchaeota archaeon]MBU1005464.1 hypothetical protein [Nanoarchaeota archaeon]MBU1947034.1 hypothetical protein [Nanoarchaeota archaeon]